MEDDESSLLSDTKEGTPEEAEIPDVMFFLNQRIICLNLIMLTLVRIVGNFNSPMLLLQVKHMPGDFETNMMAITICDIPASLFAGFVMRQGCRPKMLLVHYTLFSALAALFMVIFIDVESDSGISMPILTAMAKMGVVATSTTL